MSTYTHSITRIRYGSDVLELPSTPYGDGNWVLIHPALPTPHGLRGRKSYGRSSEGGKERAKQHYTQLAKAFMAKHGWAIPDELVCPPGYEPLYAERLIGAAWTTGEVLGHGFGVVIYEQRTTWGEQNPGVVVRADIPRELAAYMEHLPDERLSAPIQRPPQYASLAIPVPLNPFRQAMAGFKSDPIATARKVLRLSEAAGDNNVTRMLHFIEQVAPPPSFTEGALPPKVASWALDALADEDDDGEIPEGPRGVVMATPSAKLWLSPAAREHRFIELENSLMALGELFRGYGADLEASYQYGGGKRVREITIRVLADDQAEVHTLRLSPHGIRLECGYKTKVSEYQEYEKLQAKRFLLDLVDEEQPHEREWDEFTIPTKER